MQLEEAVAAAERAAAFCAQVTPVPHTKGFPLPHLLPSFSPRAPAELTPGNSGGLLAASPGQPSQWGWRRRLGKPRQTFPKLHGPRREALARGAHAPRLLLGFPRAGESRSGVGRVSLEVRLAPSSPGQSRLGGCLPSLEAERGYLRARLSAVLYLCAWMSPGGVPAAPSKKAKERPREGLPPGPAASSKQALGHHALGSGGKSLGGCLLGFLWLEAQPVESSCLSLGKRASAAGRGCPEYAGLKPIPALGNYPPEGRPCFLASLGCRLIPTAPPLTPSLAGGHLCQITCCAYFFLERHWHFA